MHALRSLPFLIGLTVVTAAGPAQSAGPPPLVVHGPAAPPPRQSGATRQVRHTVGLGSILTTKDGGQVFGFDINQNGSDGVLASAQTVGSSIFKVSVETFDQDTGKITKSFAKYTGHRNSYGMDGIVAGDVALITHYVEPVGQIYAKRVYDVMNPVTANKFTGSWTPPVKDSDVLGYAENQATTTSVFFAIELKNQDNPDLVVSNVAANQSTVFHLDPNLFGLADGPIVGQYTAANQGVIALSPDAGAVGGLAPINVLIDLKTGKQTQFNGYNNGEFHAGDVNGLAVDPNTGVAATTTELNAQVEFYNLATETGITAVQLPCTGNTSQENSGTGIAVDPVNKLFLVTDPFFCDGSQGSAIVVYDESGNEVEQITGFKFAIGEPAPVINPSKRMGWTFGPGFNQLQQFFY
jgi:hypothetical protein